MSTGGGLMTEDKLLAEMQALRDRISGDHRDRGGEP